MDKKEALDFAVSAFRERGFTVPSCASQERYYSKNGWQCHGFSFGNGTHIHFHVGIADGWEAELPSNAPNVRIRRMEFEGKPVDESNWFSC
jgi:hypothetical protein